eukprot:Gregarina_sp_Pseudo_9__1846@NODE_225_length_3521_cov_97_495405_g209_i0_p4_GENE_NODE_225_length_3521_cov_97_495405_g209_i0NODE_225_length_3521_cov_97_495405_g209_i0_p4_ORF_typecomplete_len140_score20_29_NODE_225_length_3521_cov_97_495405_g209_i037456
MKENVLAALTSKLSRFSPGPCTRTRSTSNFRGCTRRNIRGSRDTSCDARLADAQPDAMARLASFEPPTSGTSTPSLRSFSTSTRTSKSRPSPSVKHRVPTCGVAASTPSAATRHTDVRGSNPAADGWSGARISYRKKNS